MSITKTEEDVIEIQSYYVEELKNGPEYLNGILAASEEKNIEASVADIAKYQFLTLQLGIGTTKFHIKWFQDLVKKI